MNNKTKRLATIKNTCKAYPQADITENTLRWFIHKRKTNGFEKCIYRMGSKILIDLDAFENWMAEKPQAD